MEVLDSATRPGVSVLVPAGRIDHAKVRLGRIIWRNHRAYDAHRRSAITASTIVDARRHKRTRHQSLNPGPCRDACQTRRGRPASGTRLKSGVLLCVSNWNTPKDELGSRSMGYHTFARPPQSLEPQRKPLWTFLKNEHVYTCELVVFGIGSEARVLRDGDLLVARRFDQEWRTVQWAEEERKFIEATQIDF
jgi:hypothetical protein